MNLNSIMGFISTFALFIPILLILVLRLSSHRSFPVLLFYYITTFVYNLLTEGYIKADHTIVTSWGLINNLLDAPMMLYFLTYFSSSRQAKNLMMKIIFSFLVFEAIIVIAFGFNVKANTIILGPGIALVLSFCIIFFVRYAKRAIIHRKATGKAMIVSSLLFAYGCYAFLYLMYYVFKAQLDPSGKEKPGYVEDTFLVYFMVTTFSSLLMGAGLWVERKRIQKLTELKITRKELSSIYTNTKTTTPFRAVVLDFDKEHWN